MDEFNYISDASFLQDAKTGLYLGSIGGADESRYSQEAISNIVGKNLSDVFPDNTATRMLKHFQLAVESGLCIKISYPVLPLNNLAEQWYRASIQKVGDTGNVMVSSKEITREKHLLDSVSQLTSKDPFVGDFVYGQDSVKDILPNDTAITQVRFGFKNIILLNSVLTSEAVTMLESSLCRMIAVNNQAIGSLISRSVEDILINNTFTLHSTLSKQDLKYQFDIFESRFQGKVINVNSIKQSIGLDIFMEYV